MGRSQRDHCIVYRLATRPGPKGEPVSHRETEIVQERHAWKWVQDGWMVFISDSEVMTRVEANPADRGSASDAACETHDEGD